MNKDGGVDNNKMNEKHKGVKSPFDLADLGKLVKEGKREKIEESVVPMSEEQQCYELIRTVFCRLAPSKVHGVGVFAIRDIKKGQRAFCALFSKPVWYKIHPKTLEKHLSVYPAIYQLILDRWPIVVNGHPFLSPNYDARLISFMNHSDEPNYDPNTDLALRDIKAGEELFEDYKIMPNYEKVFPWLDKK